MNSELPMIRPGCLGRERHSYVQSVTQAVPALDSLLG